MANIPLKISETFLWTSIVAGIMVLATSAFGIFVNSTYARETADWATQARAQDIANVVAVAVLFVSAYFMNRGSFKGLFVWSGSLLFLVYGFVIYAFAAHYNSLFLLYVATLALSVYTLLGGVLRLDFEKVKALCQIDTNIRRVVSGYLLLAAVIFYVLWLSEDVPALLKGTVPSSLALDGLLVNPVHVLDMGFYLPAMMITGVSLWKGKGLGYTFGVPLLIFSALTGLGILVIDYLSSAIAANLGQVVFVGTLSIVSVILSWLYLRSLKHVVGARATEEKAQLVSA